MKKEIIIYDNQLGRDPPENLIEHLNWLNEIFLKIPDGFRSEAFVRIDAYESYGCGHFTYRVGYERPETDEEKNERELEIQKRLEWEKSLVRKRAKELGLNVE